MYTSAHTYLVSHAGVGSPPPTWLSSKNLIDPLGSRSGVAMAIKFGGGLAPSRQPTVFYNAYNDEHKMTRMSIHLAFAKFYLAVTLYDRLTMVSSG